MSVAQSRARDAVRGLQDWLAEHLGVASSDRQATLEALLARGEKGRAAYWLQLVLAMGIATMGLALNSSAVVIGAMLVSPLMGPIVELGMGLAIGWPFFVVRALTRTIVSVVVVVGAAAVLTLMLPFREVTAEIAARTTPTLLDLVIAGLCALAAAFTTMRSGSDTAAAAAGTAVAIALVPPLCAVGFGLGAGAREVALGAGLLFSANLSAIVLVATASFLLLGYNQVDRAALEALRSALPDARGASHRIAHWLRPAFASRFGALLRLTMPVLLVGAVAFPLGRALREVRFQMDARTAVDRVTSGLSPETVRASFGIVGRVVSVRLVVLGSAHHATAVRAELEEAIRALPGARPAVVVSAVASVDALRELAAQVERTAPQPPVPTPAPPFASPAAADLALDVAGALAARWPAAAAGELLGTDVRLRDAGLELRLVHRGEPLGPAAEDLLGAALEEELRVPVRIAGLTLPTEPIEAPAEEGARWAPLAALALERLAAVPGWRACAVVPETGDAAPVAALLRASEVARQGRLDLRLGSAWFLDVRAEACPAPPAPSDAAGGNGGAATGGGGAAPIAPAGGTAAAAGGAGP